VGWQWSFPLLAFGPAFGIGAILRLAGVRRHRPLVKDPG
jgi:hypothetical protein